VQYRKNEHPKKCIFDREDDKYVRVEPCREGELLCCDDLSDPEGPFCFFYATIFKRVLFRLPLYNFERALLTEINVAPAQLHPNSWAFVWIFSILSTHFGHLPSVEVFLYFFEAKTPRSPILGVLQWGCWESFVVPLPVILEGVQGQILQNLLQ